MLTQSEFIAISSWTIKELYLNIYGKSMEEVLTMRRGLQVALAAYAKKHKYDVVQSNIISICAQLESWARKAYFARRLPELLRNDISLLKKGKNVAKMIVKKEWEAKIKGASY